MEMKIPLDNDSLKLMLESLSACYEVDEDGNHNLVGADFSLSQLLDFWSGFDKSKLVEVGEVGGTPIFEYPEAVLSTNDLVRALIIEIQRLRGLDNSSR